MLRARVRYQRKKVAELSKALKATRPDRDAGKVMACFAQERLPVLSMLAKEFCVFTKWHASVPGETWPNRSFAHAATSDGEVNIKIRFYTNPTIFEALAAAFKKTRSKAEQKRAWAVYHDGPAQVWAYRKLWGQKGNNFRKLKHLVGEIADPNNAKNPLPRYSFVEPNHGLKLGPLFKKRSERSNNQHPNNNTAGIRDFLAAEELIASIYNALRANPNLFKKTLFLITYDEHGGFFDHEIPAKTHAPIRGGAVNPDHGFDFKSLGVRVPAVLVSPWIDQGTINQEVRDHAAIPRTIREVFIGDKNYLTRREAWAEPFHGLLNRTSPRAAGSMPPARPMGIAGACALEGISTKHFKKLEKFEDKTAMLIKRELDDLDKSLVNLTANVERELNRLAAGDPGTEAIEWDDHAGAALHDAMPSDHDLAYRLDEVAGRMQGEDN
jgi:phospholipase C